jgi:hypothetical protein
MPTRTTEREQFLADVIITAVEGGTGYWATAADYHWSDDEPTTTRVKLTPEDDREAEYLVDIDVIAKGISEIKREVHSCRSDIRESILAGDRDNDAGVIDADGADVIVQIALFGEVVYG